jgi:hypothetical protein
LIQSTCPGKWRRIGRKSIDYHGSRPPTREVTTLSQRAARYCHVSAAAHQE